MTTSAPRAPVDLAAGRAYGLALLPLALAGVLPPMTVVLLCGVYALGVRWPAWEQGRLLLGVLVVSLTAAVQAFSAVRDAVPAGGPPESVVALASGTLLGLVALAALHGGANLLQAGRRAGLLVPLGLGLLAPQPLLLLALVGGALARPAEDDRPAAWHVTPGVAAWRWPLAAALLLTLGALALPRGPSVWTTLVRPATDTLAARAVPDAPAPPPEEPSGPRTTLRPGTSGPPLRLTLDRPLLPLEAILVAGVLLGGAILWRARPRAGGERPTVIEQLMALGLVAGGVVGLVSALLLPRGAGGAAATPTAPPDDGADGMLSRVPSFDAPARTVDLSALVNVMVGATVLLIAGLTLAAFLARRAAPEELPADIPDPIDAPAGEGNAERAPLHRVRRAWRAAEAALEATGRPRLPAESPLTYAARVGRDAPLLRAPLDALARVYAPVRYGAQVSDAGAGTAERALTELRVALPTLPPPRPDDPRGTP